MRIFFTLLSSLIFAFSLNAQAKPAYSNQQIAKNWQCQQEFSNEEFSISINYQMNLKKQGSFVTKGTLNNDIYVDAEDMPEIFQNLEPKINYDLQSHGKWKLQQQSIYLYIEEASLQATSELAKKFVSLGIDFGQLIELHEDQELVILKLDKNNLHLISETYADIDSDEEIDMTIYCTAKK